MGEPRRAYDAFASYATHPDYKIVRQVERFLESLHTRSGIRSASLPALAICVDGSDFSRPKLAGGVESHPIRAIIEGYLAVSEHLILLCSSGAVASSHVAQELAHFLDTGRAGSILCAITEGADPAGQPEAIFPSRALEAGLHRLPWYDLRALRGRASKRWIKVRDAEDEMVRMAAHLWGATAGEIYPSWQRAQVRARRLLGTAAALLVAATLGAGGWFVYRSSDAYAAKEIRETRPSGVAPSAARIGALAAAGALKTADREIDAIVSPSDRAEALLRLANAKMRSDPDGAKQLYLHALQSKDTVFMSYHGRELIVRSALAGIDVKSMRLFAQADELDGAQTLVRAAEDLADLGQPDQALRIAGDDAEALLYIARKMKNRAAAYDLLRRLEAQWAPSPEVSETSMTSTAAVSTGAGSNDLVRAYLEIDRPDDALRVARTHGVELADVALYDVRHGHPEQAIALLAKPDAIARVFIAAKRFGNARDWIARMSDGRSKATLLAQVATESNDPRQTRGALDDAERLAISLRTADQETIESLGLAWLPIDPVRGAKFVRAAMGGGVPSYDQSGKLIVALAKLGFPEEAMGYAARMQQDNERQWTRHNVLEALVDKKELLPRALALASGDSEKDFVYERMVQDAAQRGKTEDVLAAFGKMSSHRNEGLAYRPLAEAVKTLAARDRIAEAAEIASKIPEPWTADVAYTDLSAEAAKLGRGSESIAAALRIGKLGWRACALATASHELRKTNRGGDAIHAAAVAALQAVKEAARASHYDREKLECVGATLAAADETDTALLVAASMDDEQMRDATLVAVSAALAKGQKFKAARRVADDIREGRRRAEAMDAILLASIQATDGQGSRRAE